MNARAIVVLAIVGVPLIVAAQPGLRLIGHDQGTKHAPSRKAIAARQELERSGISYTPETFVTLAARGNLRAVELFLDSGLNPDARNRDGFTALMWSAGQDRWPVVNALLARGANVNATSADSTTALIAAASQGHVRIVRLLIDRGATVDARRADGQTALIRASAENQNDSVKVLLAHGADIEAGDARGMTSLIYASANMSAEDPDGATLPLVQTLLSRGARPEHRAADGSTALAWAARKGEESILHALISKNGDVNAADNDGETPLMHAALGRGTPSIAEALIARGADVNAQDTQGTTALAFSARRRTAGMLKVLLENGADSNSRNNEGTTPLIEATRLGRVDNVKTLLERGADSRLKDNHGRTAADIAKANHQSAILAILSQAPD